MTAEHDWNLILKSEGDDPIAPSVMPLLDRALDADAALKKFWDTMEQFFLKVGHGSNSRSMAYKSSADCDLAVMNLIATHYGAGITHHHLSTAFGFRYNHRVIRRYIVLALTVEDSLTTIKRSGAILAVANAKSQHHKTYSLSSDEGYRGQKALAEFTAKVMDQGSRFLKHKIFSADENARTTWYSDEAIVELVMSRPDDTERIADIVLERQSIDAEMVREVLATQADALSSGVL